MRECDLLRIDGTVSRKNRDARVEEFISGKGPTVFLLSAKVGGEGLTLTAATRVIIVDPAYNLSDDNQISDRVYRIGQKRDVVIYLLFTCSTIEEHIYKLQLIKGSMAQAVVEGKICASLVRKEDGNVLALPESFEHSKTYDLLVRELGDNLELDHKQLTFLRKHSLVKGITDQSSVFSESEALPDVSTDESSEDETTVQKKKHGKCATGTETSDPVVSWKDRLRSSGHTVQNLAPKENTAQPIVIKRTIEISADKVGFLYGKGGSAITQISRRSSTRITVVRQPKDHQDANRQVHIVGTSEEIEKAIRLIMETINVVDQQSTNDLNNVIKKVYVPVPRDQVGRIIGSGGKRVIQIESQSGARVENTSSAIEGRFVVTGTVKAIETAQSMIMDILNKIMKRSIQKMEDNRTSTTTRIISQRQHCLWQ